MERTEDERPMEDNEDDVEADFQVDFDKLSDVPCLLKLHIEKMHKHIVKQRETIARLREQLTVQQDGLATVKTFAHCGVQTADTPPCERNRHDATCWDTSKEGNSKSIEEQVKQAAESALLQSGLVYEETSGLYYDYKSGYYYDANQGLYYDGNSGTYYYYDSVSRSYKIHSQSAEFVRQVRANKKQMKKLEKQGREESNKVFNEIDDLVDGLSNDGTKKRKITGQGKGADSEEPEEGECSGSDGDETSSDRSLESSSDNESSEARDAQDLAKTYPPCMRIVVQETNVPKLRAGALFIVAYTGGSLGREGDHSVLIQDINVSKHHARFLYDEDKNRYQIIDMASRNGTILNGKRLSVAKQESDPYDVTHGSVIQVGGTKLVCHIHTGNSTCGHCEPGLVQHHVAQEEDRSSKKDRHKQELRRLKCKFGVEKDNVASASQLAAGYRDRAQARREFVGSSNHHVKTQQSSIHTSITSDNKGFKLLSKMGWSEGQSLGRDGDGRTEPVALGSNQNKAGLGSVDDGFPLIEADSIAEKKHALWRKTQERYKHTSVD